MPSPTTTIDFLDLVNKSRLVSQEQLDDLFGSSIPTDAKDCAAALIRAEMLTPYQAKQLLGGKFRGFYLGAYKILRPIGQGGMGAVYLAEHTSLNRKVAVKVLTADKAKDKLTLERFNREARAAAALDHPNIVRLHDISQGGGVHFLVMEYVEGNDLHTLMAQTGPLHYAQAAQYVAQAAAGLQHAHDKGFIHRDIKPANLMLTKDGAIKILDMGLARSFTDSKDNLTAILAEGDIAGTVDFLSPEQAMNSPLDERSDIYSLGATFYALVTGHPPFNGTTAQKLMQHQMKEPQSVVKKLNGRVPPALSDVITKMMAKKPNDRIQTAADVIDALGPWLPAVTTGNIVQDAVQMSEMTLTGDPTRLLRGSKNLRPMNAVPVWKRPPVLIGAGVGLVLLVGGIIAALVFGGKSEPTNKYATGPNGQAGQPPPQQPVPPPNRNQSNATNPTPPAAIGNAAVLYQLNASKVKPFRMKIDFDISFGGANIRDAVPGWQYEVYDKESDGEAMAEVVDGRTVLGIGSRNGKNAAQFTFQPSKLMTVAMDAGKEYQARVEYKTEAGVSGNVGIQTIHEWKILGGSNLPPSASWKTVTFPVTRPDGKEIQFTFGTTAVSTGFLKIRSFEIIDPTVAGPAFRLSAADLPVFRNKKVGSQLTQGEQPQLAAGVYFHGHKADTTGDYFCEVVDGQKALGWSNTEGPVSGQLGIELEGANPAAKAPLTVGKKYRSLVVYKTEGGANGATYVQTHGDWKIVDDKWVDLPDTGGQWKTVEYDWTKPAETVRLLVDNQSSGASAVVYVREVSVTEADERAAALPATAAPVTPAAPKSALPVVPVKADFAAFPVGAFAVSPDGPVPTDGQADLHTVGWSATTYEKDATGELSVTPLGGSKVVNLANKSGKPSMQLYQTAAGSTLVAGQSYRLTLEYKAAEGTTGVLEVREKSVGNWSDCPYKYTLDSTKGLWEKRTFEIQPARDYPPVFVVQNRSDTLGNSLSVRSLELIPLGGDRPSPGEKAAPPSDGRVAYALDLTNQKAFVVRRKARDTTDLSRTGDGTPPAGWRSHSWEATCEHELYAEVRDGAPTLGLRFVSGKAAGMLAVDGITVQPNSTYELTFEYMTPGEYIGDNGFRYRSTGNGGKLYLGGKLDKTDGTWVEKVVTIKTDAIASLQLEFHHNGPGGEENPLLIRKCKLELAAR